MKTSKMLFRLVVLFIMTSALLSQFEIEVQAKVIELRLASMFPAGSPSDRHIHRWADKIAKDSKGQLKIRIFPMNALLTAPEIPEGVAKGAVDLGYSYRYKPTNYTFGVNFNELIPAENTYIGMKIYDDIWKRFPKVMAKEWKDVKVLWQESTVPVQLFTSKPVRTLDDVRGLQIRVPSKMMATMINSIGAAPVFMSPADLIISLDKKMVDGACGASTMIVDFKLGKKIKSIVMYSFGIAVPCSMLMNKRSFDRLPVDLQKVLEDNNAMAREDGIKTWSDTYDALLVYCRNAGIEIVNLTPEQKVKWNRAIKSARVKIAQQIDKKGYPGTELLEFIEERLNYYSKQ